MTLRHIEERYSGTLRSDDGDGNKNGIKAIDLLSKTTTLHVHHTFLYISLPFLLDYDVKMPFSCFIEDVNKQRRNFLLFPRLTWITLLGIQIQEISPTYDKESEME